MDTRASRTGRCSAARTDTLVRRGVPVRHRRVLRIARLVTAACCCCTMVLVACAPVAGGDPPLTATLVASGFNQPLYVTHAPDDDSRIFVLEQPGRIRIVVSKGLKRDFVRHYGQSAEDILVVSNGVDLAKFHPHNKGLYREEIRDRHHLAPGDFVALFVGSYWGRKGLQYAIQALALVPREDVKLVVVGKWLAQESYLEMARKGGVEDRVVFAGNSKEVYKYYAASDVFLLPTGYEAFPLTSLEAAASGLPILITKVNGVDEWLVDNHNGLFIQQDAEDIATKLQTLLADAELAAMLGDNARRTAEKYSWDAMISKMLEVYQQVASPKR